jgi:hypothetical protein
MSTRTIIEINHDYWHDLDENPEAMKQLLQGINTFNPDDSRLAHLPGVRILGQRHHSETLKLTVK